MASIKDGKRKWAECMGGTPTAQIATADALIAAGFIRTGARGGKHNYYHLQLYNIAAWLLGFTAPRKTEIGEHVRRVITIMPTFGQQQVTDAPLIADIMRKLSVGPGPQSGLIPGSSLPLGAAIERVIDRISNDHALGDMLKKAKFQLEVLEAPPLYVPQASFVMQCNGRRYDIHYSGSPEFSPHDKTDVPQEGPLIRTTRIGAEFFIGAAELWCDTKLQEVKIPAV